MDFDARGRRSFVVSSAWAPMDVRARVLFVYGTLLSGERSHDRLGGSEKLGDATTEAIFHLVDLGPYPAMVIDGTTAVAGELYRVDVKRLGGRAGQGVRRPLRGRRRPRGLRRDVRSRDRGELAGTEVGSLADDVHVNLLGDILDTYAFALVP
jgi:hypothetical protein